MVVSTSGNKIYIYKYDGSKYIINQTISYPYYHPRKAWLSDDNNYLIINNFCGPSDCYNTEIR